MTPSLGLAIIARNEADTLPHLLTSVSGAFDSVALADTGSTDRTVEVFEDWATAADLPRGWRVESFPWCDDFAAAREFADSLLRTDWLASADADDEIQGAGHLRGLVASVPPECACLAFDHLGGAGGPRVRMTRRGSTRWDGRVHEVPVLTRPGGIAVVPSDVTAWVHRRPDRPGSAERDRRLLEDWLSEEPDNPRALGLSANDMIGRGERDEAADLLGRYLDSPTTGAALGPCGLDAARDALASFRRGEGDAVEPILFGGMVA